MNRLAPPPSVETKDSCGAESLRLIEHYELDYQLSPDPSNDQPADGAEVAARRWNTYYCSTCRTDFTERPLAFAHLGEDGLLARMS